MCLPVNCFDFLPQGPCWPGLHLLQAEAEPGPRPSRWPSVPTACSSCREQVAGRAEEDDRQGSSLEGGSARKEERVDLKRNSKFPPPDTRAHEQGSQPSTRAGPWDFLAWVTATGGRGQEKERDLPGRPRRYQWPVLRGEFCLI